MTIDQALTRYLTRYQLSQRRGFPAVRMRVERRLRPFFSARPADLTEDDLFDYWSARAADGVKNATVRAELAALRRALKLARLHVPAMPEDMTLDPPRQGFVEVEDFERLCAALPARLRSPFRVAYVTGWRMRSEVCRLEKQDVDLTGGWLMLRDSKNRDPRRFPLQFFGLRELLERQLAEPPADCAMLFSWAGGRPLRDLRASWRTACRAAGLQLHIHDFRRSAVRNLTNAGVDQKTAMLLTGHRTDSVFRAYRIVNEADLRGAVAKLESYLTR